MLFISTASGSSIGFHFYCHFLVAVEVAVAFQNGSRKESGSRKVNDRILVTKEIGIKQHNACNLQAIF